MDAVVGMESNGPASADLRSIGRILASDNAVALDAVVARMMGLDPDRLRFLQKARELGLGDYSFESIEIIGELHELPDFKLPPLSGEAILHNKAMQDMLRTKSGVKPAADPDLCTGCGECIKHCPVESFCSSFPDEAGSSGSELLFFEVKSWIGFGDGFFIQVRLESCLNLPRNFFIQSSCYWPLHFHSYAS